MVEFFIKSTSYAPSFTWTENTWHRLLCSRASGIVYIAVDGTLLGTANIPAATDSGLSLLLGVSAHNSSERMIGNLDEVRLTVGDAVHTANYTLDSSEFSP
jgi:hypothetical protein